MDSRTVGVIHPGNMGVFVAATARNTGHDVRWASAGRSAATRERAEGAGLRDAGSLAELCRTCSVLVERLPAPRRRGGGASRSLALGYQGLYVDANAISPQRVQRIGEAMAAAGVPFVDGGIVGGPAWEGGQTWLYLAGADAAEAASLFTAGPLETTVLGRGGQAGPRP